MYEGGSNFHLSEEQMANLSDMLDPQNGASRMAFKRPATQEVGYSLSEAQPRTVQSATTVENNVGKVAANPGAIFIPSSVGSNNPHLPTVSGSKAAKAQEAKSVAKAKPKGNDIWADDEIDGAYGSTVGSAAPVAAATGHAGGSGTSGAGAASTAAIAPPSDKRQIPEFEVLYRQKQTAEDAFLGADFTRDGSAAMAEELVVKLKLPLLESIKDLEVEVEAFAMHMRSREYKARVDLPTRVIEKKGAAKWDGNTKILSVTLTTNPDDRKVKVMS